MTHEPSAPPPSPTPPPPSADVTLPPGWQPAHTDESHRATSWRARTALRRADRALASFAALQVSVDRLDATIAAATSRLELWAGRAGKVLGALVIAGSIALARLVWGWVSTLHH